MRYIPDINPRRPLDDDNHYYQESDKDFVNNNLELAVILLESIEKNKLIVTRDYNGVTARKTLLQVLSRPISTFGTLDVMVDVSKDQFPKSKIKVMLEVEQ